MAVKRRVADEQVRPVVVTVRVPTPRTAPLPPPGDAPAGARARYLEYAAALSLLRAKASRAESLALAIREAWDREASGAGPEERERAAVRVQELVDDGEAADRAALAGVERLLVGSR